MLPAWEAYHERKSYAPLHEDDPTSQDAPTSSRDRPSQWPFFILLCVTHLLSMAATFFYLQQHISDHVMDLAGTSAAYPSVDRSLTLQPFSQFSLNSSKYTDTPAPKVDGAWHRLGLKSSTFILSGEVGAQHYGLDPQHFQYVKKGVWNNKKEGYPVVLQALHDLHCVNMLRKSLYYNYPYYTNYIDHDKEPEPTRIAHINHCVDALRERVMCTADMGVIPFAWSRPNGGAKPYFGTQHKCHDFDSVLQWALDNAEDVNTTQIDVPVPEDAVFDTVSW